MPLQVPRTPERLNSSVTIYAMPDPVYLAKTISSGNAAAIAQTAVSLGVATATQVATGNSQMRLAGVKKFARKQDRTITRIYSLGANSFEPARLIPGKITTTLTLDRVTLYKNDALKVAFGFCGENLIVQQVPLLITEFKNDPNNPNDSMATSVVLYTECWVASNPVEYDIMAEDQLVIQSREVEVGKAIVVDLTLGGIVSAVSSTINIATNIKY